MRAKSLLLLMLALGCGIVASIGITQVMAKRNAGDASSSTEMQAIFVALENVPMGDPLTAQVMKLEEWPKDKIPTGALTKIEDVEGRRPKTIIYQGSPILESQLLGKGADEEGATGLIPKGYRVVSIKVDSVSGGASLIRPGDRVDVLVHLQFNLSKGIQETTTRTILQDIKVFAVDNVFNLESVEGDASISAKTISLLVTPAHAEKLMLATELGQIRLIMRSSQDNERTEVAGAVPHELFGASEASERHNENRFAARPTTGEDANMDEFMQVLNSQRSGTPSSGDGAVDKDSWRMRIISADQVDDVRLESENAPSSSETSKSGVSFWKTTSSAAGPALNAAATAPGGKKPLAGNAEEEPAGQEEVGEEEPEGKD